MLNFLQNDSPSGTEFFDELAELTQKSDLSNLIYNMPIIDSATNKILLTTVSVAVVISIIFAAFTIGYYYLRDSLKSLKTGQIEWPMEETIRIGVLMSLIFMYIPLINFVVMFTDTLTMSTAPSLEKSKKWAEYYYRMHHEVDKSVADPNYQANQFISSNGDKLGYAPGYINWSKYETLNAESKASGQSTVNNPNAPSSEGSFSIWDLFKYIGQLMGLAFNALNALVWQFAAGIIKLIIMFFALMTAKLLICLGPLAIAFSIIPVFSKQMESWLSTLIACLLIGVTLNILDLLFGATISWVAESGNPALSSASTLFYITFFVMYLCAFWFTSKWAGKGDGGKVMSKAVGLAAAATGAGMAAKGASSAAGAASSAAKAGGDALKDE